MAPRLLLKIIKCPICYKHAATSVDDLYQHILTHKCRRSCDVLFHRKGKCGRTPAKKLSCWKCKRECASVQLLMTHLEYECSRCSTCTSLNCECEVNLLTYDPDQPDPGQGPDPPDTGQVRDAGELPNAGQDLERGRHPECLTLPKAFSPQPSTSRAAQVGMGETNGMYLIVILDEGPFFDFIILEARPFFGLHHTRGPPVL
ncbi:unnamed protein product [Orchesella dallaii]|uniref:C2H2-type domain-containing protein n=1 Tax=Orchesella dallaii TaxID=48710 RepID=A0ABP1PJ84_9HEXA